MEALLRAFDVPDFGLKRLGLFCVDAARHVKDHFIPHARNNYHPHILGNRALALFSAALVCVKVCAIALLAFGPILPAFSSAINEANIISLTNQSRESFKMPDLVENQTLDLAAQTKANDMLAKGYFSHNSPDGRVPWDFITAAGYNYLMAGENLAVNFIQAEDVETAWMNSPGHRANILNKNFEDIGVGISQGQFQGHEAIFVVQMFGTPAAQKIAIDSAPTPVQTSVVPKPAAQAPTVAPANQSRSDIAPAPAAPANTLAVTEGQSQIQEGQVTVSAKISGAPVKVFAVFGSKAVMLQPKDDGSWGGQMLLSDLTSGPQTVMLKAYDISGKMASLQLADFTNNIADNYQVLGASSVQPTQVSWWGKVFDPKGTEEKVYLFFIAGILASLVLAIGIKRHIQHLHLIANTSLVVMLACVLMMVR